MTILESAVFLKHQFNIIETCPFKSNEPNTHATKASLYELVMFHFMNKFIQY